jgi:hypothetical protein
LATWGLSWLFLVAGDAIYAAWGANSHLLVEGSKVLRLVPYPGFTGETQTTKVSGTNPDPCSGGSSPVRTISTCAAMQKRRGCAGRAGHECRRGTRRAHPGAQPSVDGESGEHSTPERLATVLRCRPADLAEDLLAGSSSPDRNVPPRVVAPAQGVVVQPIGLPDTDFPSLKSSASEAEPV